MSFNPVTLYGPVSDYVSLPKGDKNQSCIGFANLNASPIGLVPSAVNCAGEDEYPNLYFGNAASKARLYASSGDPLSQYNFPLLSEKRLVAQDADTQTFTEWAMNGDLMAGCEAVATYAYVPDYELHFNGDTGICGVAENDYRKIADYFHTDVHMSYLDCFRIHDGDESARVSLRSYTYDTMNVPSYYTLFEDILDSYTLTWRSDGSPASGYRAMMTVQESSTPGFNPGTITYTDPYEMSDLGGYCESIVVWPTPASTTRYFRAKRRDELIADPTTYTETGWSTPFSVSPRERTDSLKLNGSPAATPYYCDLVYNAAGRQHRWYVGIDVEGGDENQDADLVRIQVASDSAFSTVLDTDAHTITWYANGESYGIVEFKYDLPVSTLGYARCRYENADGSVVGPWSNVFTMDGSSDGANAVSRSNKYNHGGDIVPETHWTGDRIIYYLRSNPLYKDGHVYVVLGRNRQHNEAGTLTDFGSLYLADYTATTVTLSLVVSEIADWDTMPTAIYGTPPHTDLIEVGGKLYADCTSSESDFFDWCEVTGGTVGTIYHVSYPTGVTAHLWVTIGNIHGTAMAVASLDTGSAFEMGLAPLSGDTIMVAYPTIQTGYYFVKDPWLNSLWYDSSNYDSSITAICWLGSGVQSNAVWYMGI